MTDHKKPGVAFWATVVVVAVLAYPLSFGPAMWLVRHEFVPIGLMGLVEGLYRPLGLAAHYAPDYFGKPLFWYAELWSLLD